MTTTEHTTTQRGQYVQANGLDIYYEEQGEGSPLLLIHGGILTGESWQSYLPSFAKHFRVLMPDSRGHGRTHTPTGEMSFGALADDMVALVQALGLHKPLIFGYSDGGQIALDIGMRYPDVPQALVIGGAHLELSEGSRRWVRSILGDPESPEVDFEHFEREEAGFAAFLKELHGAQEWKTLLKNIKPMWNAQLNYSADDFARMTMPTLVLVGDRDDFVPVEDAIEMYRRLPNAEVAVIPNSNHTNFFDAPDTIALLQPLVVDFLLRHDSTDTSA
jgi:pimeloyl-ACP methyl ester carboxylesterase